MAWNRNLAGSALNIARTDSSPLRVMAGPGTGKSFALMRRVMRLLEFGANPTTILAVTFTRTAADALVRDLRALKVVGSEKIRASTLHAYCFSLLNQEEVFEFSGRTPRPLMTFEDIKIARFEAEPMLADLQRDGDFGANRECTKKIRAFEAAWARLQSDMPGWPTDPVDSLFHDRLISWLRFHEAMLVGELIPEALNFLRNNPLSRSAQTFTHVLVDEYQDLNRAEQDLVDLIARYGRLTIVGDVDQSIYNVSST